MNAMHVAVKKVPRAYLHATKLHRLTELDDVSVSMRHGDASGEDLKTSDLDPRQIATPPLVP